MVAFKEEFPYLKAETGQLFEFDRGWLREAITRAANDAGLSQLVADRARDRKHRLLSSSAE